MMGLDAEFASEWLDTHAMQSGFIPACGRVASSATSSKRSKSSGVQGVQQSVPEEQAPSSSSSRRKRVSGQTIEKEPRQKEDIIVS